MNLEALRLAMKFAPLIIAILRAVLAVIEEHHAANNEKPNPADAE